MKTTVHFCDLCLLEYKAKLAIGFYRTDENKIYDACDKHRKEIEQYGFTFVHFGATGNSLKLDERLLYG